MNGKKVVSFKGIKVIEEVKWEKKRKKKLSITRKCYVRIRHFRGSFNIDKVYIDGVKVTHAMQNTVNRGIQCNEGVGVV